MKESKEEYQKLCKDLTPPSPSHRTVPAAFLVGGALCALAQLIRTLLERAGLPEKSVAAAVSCALIFLGVTLTAARLFEKLAKFAGAGTLVPITGFANSIAAPALEFKTDDRVIIGTSQKHHEIKVDVLV